MSAAPLTSPQEVFIKCPLCQIDFLEKDIAQHADVCAAPQAFQQEQPTENENVDSPGTCLVVADKKALLKCLEPNLKSQVAHINVRHGRLFSDDVHGSFLKINSKIVFIGEPAIDTGRPRPEFLTGKTLY